MKFLYICLSMLVASNAFAASFQNDMNKARTGFVPYHNELMRTLHGTLGVPQSTLPASVQAKVTALPDNNVLKGDPTTLQTQPMDKVVVNAYHLFANNGWSIETIPNTTSSGNLFTTTTTTTLQIKGANSFTGESYDSGAQVIAQSSGPTMLNNLLQVSITIIVICL